MNANIEYANLTGGEYKEFRKYLKGLFKKALKGVFYTLDPVKEFNDKTEWSEVSMIFTCDNYVNNLKKIFDSEYIVADKKEVSEFIVPVSFNKKTIKLCITAIEDKAYFDNIKYYLNGYDKIFLGLTHVLYANYNLFIDYKGMHYAKKEKDSEFFTAELIYTNLYDALEFIGLDPKVMSDANLSRREVIDIILNSDIYHNEIRTNLFLQEHFPDLIEVANDRNVDRPCDILLEKLKRQFSKEEVEERNVNSTIPYLRERLYMQMIQSAINDNREIRSVQNAWYRYLNKILETVNIVYGKEWFKVNKYMDQTIFARLKITQVMGSESELDLFDLCIQGNNHEEENSIICTLGFKTSISLDCSTLTQEVKYYKVNEEKCIGNEDQCMIECCVNAFIKWFQDKYKHNFILEVAKKDLDYAKYHLLLDEKSEIDATEHKKMLLDKAYKKYNKPNKKNR